MPFESAWKRDKGEIIDFSIGQPSIDLLPTKLLEQSYQSLNNDMKANLYDPRLMLQYGDSNGDKKVLENIAKFLSFEYKKTVSPSNLFITNGNSLGIELCCSCLIEDGNRLIFVEDPTYFLALNIFRDHNTKIVAVNTDTNGLVIEDFEDQIKVHGAPAFIYIIPAFNNPSGSTLSSDRRQKLAKICEENDIKIVCDDVYAMLWFEEDSRPPPVLPFYTDQAISLGSFSKIMAPGLRLGWIQCSEKLVEMFATRGYVCSGGCLNSFTSSIISQLVNMNLLSNHVNEIRKELNTRKNALCQELRRLKDFKFVEPKGGYFVWGELPKNSLPDIEKIKTVAYTAGTRCSVTGEKDNFLRFSFAYYDAATLAMGIDRLIYPN